MGRSRGSASSVMPAELIDQFLDTRAEIIEVKTQRLHYGWVLPDSQDDELHVECPSAASLDLGSKVLVLLKNCATGHAVPGKVTLSKDQQLRLTISMNAVKRPGDKTSRFRNKISLARITTEEGTYMATVFDISEGGIGIQTLDPYSPGDIIEIIAEVDDAKIPVTVEVMYCKNDPNCAFQFRVGGKVKVLGRVDQMRWKNLFEPARGTRRRSA